MDGQWNMAARLSNHKYSFTRTISVPVSVAVSVKFTLKDRIGSDPNLSVKQSFTIGTMMDFDGDGHRHGGGKCKRALEVGGRLMKGP